MPVLAADWVDQVLPFSELVRILNFYLDLECWIISLSRPSPWMPIRYHQRDPWPVELDDLFGRREARVLYNRTQIDRAVRGKKTVCAPFDGFHSFFIPILRGGRPRGVIQCGPFLRREPTRRDLLEGWRAMTGGDVPRFDLDFSRYVRAVLETPVVEGPVFRALRDLLLLHAQAASGEGGAAAMERACRTAERMKAEVFARHLPNRFWVEKAVKNNRLYPPDWWVEKARADQWRREEQGLDREPSLVMAVMPDGEAQGSPDDLQTLLDHHRFQRRFFEMAKNLPGTLAGPLEDYGMVFFTSPAPGANEVQAKLEILDRVDKLSQAARKELGIRILVGVGRCLGEERNLSRVYREAVLALEFCRPLSRPILFYEDLHHNPSLPKPPLFYEMSRKLVEVYRTGAVRQVEPIRSRYIEQVLAHAAGRPETVRLHFLFVCGQVVDALTRKKPQQESELAGLLASLEKKLRETGDVQDLTAVFRDSLRRLLDLVLKPGTAPRSDRAAAARAFLDKNFAEDLKLGEVARRHGFSTSVFAREFKRETGLGFSTYLKRVRVAHARRLLVSTQMPIAQVSQDSGFNNLHYFFDVYKRETGQTPGESRSNNARSK
ncbi:MAG TPA: helix-turn-helix domain-containing protein [bacterium]|nr:helix-turn-helix domain-containing protein [bacterium]